MNPAAFNADPAGTIKSMTIDRPDLQKIVDEAFKTHAPLTSALVAAGLVASLEGVAKTMMEFDETDDLKVPPEHLRRVVSLPFTHSPVGFSVPAAMTMDGTYLTAGPEWVQPADPLDPLAVKEAAERVAAEVEKQVKSVFANCRVVIGLPPAVIDLQDGRGPRVMTIMNAYTSRAKPLYQYGGC